MTRELLCITCPTGCRLQASIDESGTLTVAGNGCKRGSAFARAELTAPTRSLTTTVRTNRPHTPALPVRTDGEIPKALIPQAMKALAGVVAQAPLACGDTLLEDLCGSGVRVIATNDLPSTP